MLAELGSGAAAVVWGWLAGPPYGARATERLTVALLIVDAWFVEARLVGDVTGRWVVVGTVLGAAGRTGFVRLARTSVGSSG